VEDNQTLLQYLLMHDLSGAEVDSLKPMLLFAAHGNPNERRKTTELYAPNKDVDELGLTVLSWQNSSEEWSNESKEGDCCYHISPNYAHPSSAKLLFKIGLRKYPDLLELLKMASAAERRETALKFLLRHFEDEYQKSYLANYTTTAYAEIPFIPVEGESELSIVSKVSKSLQDLADCLSCFIKVYIHRECVFVGFRRVREDFRVNAERFKVQEQPSPSAILDCLSNSPPTSDNAQKCFEYLWNRVQGICIY
jgi:Protein of unknown function (DUF3684)